VRQKILQEVAKYWELKLKACEEKKNPRDEEELMKVKAKYCLSYLADVDDVHLEALKTMLGDMHDYLQTIWTHLLSTFSKEQLAEMKIAMPVGADRKKEIEASDIEYIQQYIDL